MDSNYENFHMYNRNECRTKTKSSGVSEEG